MKSSDCFTCPAKEGRFTSSHLRQELQAMRENVGIYDASSSGQLAIEGPDAPSFLQRLVSNEVEKTAVGEGRYNAILDRKGMVLSLFYLIRLILLFLD